MAGTRCLLNAGFIPIRIRRRKKKVLLCGLPSKMKGWGVSWCQGTNVQNSNSWHQTVAIRSVWKPIWFSYWLSEVVKWRIFAFAEFAQILLRFHHTIEDSVNRTQPGPPFFNRLCPQSLGYLGRQRWSGIHYICQNRNSRVPEWSSEIVTSSFNSEGMRETWEVNQTETRPTQFLMFSAAFLWEIYFLEACHFFVECCGWGFCLTAVVGMLVTEMLKPNTEAWLKKANFLSKKNAQLTPCVKRRALLFRRASKGEAKYFTLSPSETMACS